MLERQMRSANCCQLPISAVLPQRDDAAARRIAAGAAPRRDQADWLGWMAALPGVRHYQMKGKVTARRSLALPSAASGLGMK